MSNQYSAWSDASPVRWAEFAKQIRHRDSVESKILAFFDANPDEELFVTDACAKFGSTDITHMRRLLKCMVDKSLLTRHWVGDCYVYCAGVRAAAAMGEGK